MDPIKVDFSGKKAAKEVVIPPEKKTLKLIITLAVTVIGAAIAYYFMLPPINFKAMEFYYFIGVVILIYLIMTVVTSMAFRKPEYIPYVKKMSKAPLIIAGVFIAILLVGFLVSAPLFRADAYSKIIDVTTENFGESEKSITTIKSIEDFQSVPMIDKDASLVLANKTLGELNKVSQFVIDADYSTQINYNNNPYRIFPLKYGDFFKWAKNTKEGFPAYVRVNMYTQEAEIVDLKENNLPNIKVSTGEYLNNRLDRVLRFKFPTYMFGTPSLEIDESGHPYWVCERLDRKIGLLGGTDVIGVVLVDACDKENIKYYDIEEVKTNAEIQWIDQIYSEDLLVQQYNYYGKYSGGFINAYIGQEAVVVTTQGASCIASGDDVWLYTGVTSVTDDDSIIGFAIINQRTKEAVFQRIAGTTESGAQTSAQGIVSDKGWTATFPILLNIDGEATYFMSLKDNDIVKSYAMVNVEDFYIAVRSENDAKPDLKNCLQSYASQVKSSTGTDIQIDYGEGSSSGSSGEDVPTVETKQIEGTITDIRTAVVNGNSIYYFSIDNSEVYYSLAASSDNSVVILNVGDKIKVTYIEAEGVIIPAKNINK